MVLSVSCQAVTIVESDIEIFLFYYFLTVFEYLLNKHVTCNRVKRSGYSNATKGKINNRTCIWKKYKLGIKKTYKEDSLNLFELKKTKKKWDATAGPIHTARQTRQDGPVCVVSGGVNWVGPAARQVRSASECVRRSHRQCLPKLINFPNQYYNFCRSSLFGNVKITVTFKRPFGHRDFSKCGILLNSSMNRGPKWLGGSTTKFSTIFPPLRTFKLWMHRVCVVRLRVDRGIALWHT